MAENDKKQYTAEQEGAINSRGKVIVSASAGSGKTFVMIEKLALAIENGADLDEVRQDARHDRALHRPVGGGHRRAGGARRHLYQKGGGQHEG